MNIGFLSASTFYQLVISYKENEGKISVIIWIERVKKYQTKSETLETWVNETVFFNLKVKKRKKKGGERKYH